MAALCLVLLVTAAVLLGLADHNVTGRITVIRMFPAFVAGAALAVFDTAVIRGAAYRPTAGAGGRLATTSFAVCPAVCLLPPLGVLAPIAMAGLILGLAFEEGPIHRMMASGPVVWLGKISFSLYLTNMAVIDFLVWLTAGRSGDVSSDTRNWTVATGRTGRWCHVVPLSASPPLRLSSPDRLFSRRR